MNPNILLPNRFFPGQILCAMRNIRHNVVYSVMVWWIWVTFSPSFQELRNWIQINPDLKLERVLPSSANWVRLKYSPLFFYRTNSACLFCWHASYTHRQQSVNIALNKILIYKSKVHNIFVAVSVIWLARLAQSCADHGQHSGECWQGHFVWHEPGKLWPAGLSQGHIAMLGKVRSIPCSCSTHTSMYGYQ